MPETKLLIEQCKENNRKAQMALYSKYCDAMLINANRYLKDIYEAEDAVQEAFIKAFKKLEQYQGEVAFGAWLKKIVVHTCLDKIKVKKFTDVELDEQVLSIAEETNWSIADEITVEEVKKAIEELPEKYKLVVMLFLIEGYDHSEIASILNITESASRIILHRGKKLLYEKLKHLQYGTGY